MKIVIDIPEWQYKSICEEIEASKRCGVVGIDPDIHEAIYNGVPLPKGHGRLIDADDLIQDIIDDSQLCIFNSECERIVHDKMVDFAVDRITEAPPIIEADKEVNDD